MCAVSFFKRVVNIPRSLCLVVGGVMSRALYLGGINYCKSRQLGKYTRSNNSYKISLSSPSLRSLSSGISQAAHS